MVNFNGYMIRNFSLEKMDNIPEEKQKGFDLECNCYQNDEKGKENQYRVSIGILMYTNSSKIDLTLEGFFEVPNNLGEEVKQNFLDISAPAILYPYARTFISNVTGFDIDDTVILPIINFANFHKQN